jgi:uncharacterized membrane protein YidH (DUF202 family)
MFFSQSNSLDILTSLSSQAFGISISKLEAHSDDDIAAQLSCLNFFSINSLNLLATIWFCGSINLVFAIADFQALKNQVPSSSVKLREFIDAIIFWKSLLFMKWSKLQSDAIQYRVVYIMSAFLSHFFSASVISHSPSLNTLLSVALIGLRFGFSSFRDL